MFLYPSAMMEHTLDPGTSQLSLHLPLMANFSGLQCPRFISHSHFIEHWLQLCCPSPHSRTPKLQTVHVWHVVMSWHRGGRWGKSMMAFKGLRCYSCYFLSFHRTWSVWEEVALLYRRAKKSAVIHTINHHRLSPIS